MVSFGAVMPTYNQAAYLEEAVESVVNQLNQLVIVDDGCSDNTPHILRELSDRYPHIQIINKEKNEGTAKAINTGRRVLTSTWQTWISSDNTYTPNWVSVIRDHIRPNTGALYSNYLRTTHNASSTSVYRMPYDKNQLISSENCFFGPSFFIRKDVWDIAGEHRGQISHDYDHWLRIEEVILSRQLDIVHIDRILCIYLTHPEMAGVKLKHLYDANIWREAAKVRRSL